MEGGRTGESEDAIIERQRWRLTTPLSPRPANHGCRWCRGDTARRHSDSAGTNRSNRFPLSRPINGIPRPTRLRDSPRIYSILLLPIIQLWKNFPPNSTVYYSRLNRTSKRVSCEIRLFIFTNDIKIFIKKYIILFSIAKKRLNFQREKRTQGFSSWPTKFEKFAEPHPRRRAATRRNLSHARRQGKSGGWLTLRGDRGGGREEEATVGARHRRARRACDTRSGEWGGGVTLSREDRGDSESERVGDEFLEDCRHGAGACDRWTRGRHIDPCFYDLPPFSSFPSPLSLPPCFQAPPSVPFRLSMLINMFFSSNLEASGKEYNIGNNIGY